MAHLSSVVLCSNKSFTAHQRQINNSIMSKDIVLSKIIMSVIFTDLKFTVCHNRPPFQARFCVTHAVITGICCTLLLWRQRGAAKMMQSKCVQYVDGQRVGWGEVMKRYTYEEKKTGEDGQRAGIMVSIYRACRVENKQGQKEKQRKDGRCNGGGQMKGSVFILVQVRLFIKVIFLWRCKAFLKNKEKKKYHLGFCFLFYFVITMKMVLKKDKSRYFISNSGFI